MKKSVVGYLEEHRYVSFNNTLLRIESLDGEIYSLGIYVQVDESSIVKYEYTMNAYEYSNFLTVIIADAKREIRNLLKR